MPMDRALSRGYDKVHQVESQGILLTSDRLSVMSVCAPSQGACVISIAYFFFQYWSEILRVE